MAETYEGWAPMLTTFDNPYNPFENFDLWFKFDVQKGYNSCSILARISKTSDLLSDSENAEEIERSIDFIIDHDLTGMYKKVYPPSSKA